MSQKKRGKLSNEEMRYIRDNHSTMPVEEIAVNLNRNNGPIVKYIDKISIEAVATDHSDQQELVHVLRGRWYWPELQAQFTDHELLMFQSQWVEYYSQFGEDVVPTEENEMIELIRTDILIDRGMRELKNANMQIENIQKQMDEEFEQELPNDTKLALLGERLSQMHGIKNTHGAAYEKLLTKKASFTKSLKGTRDQRRKTAQDSKTNFSAWLRTIEDAETKRREGITMEKHRIAAQKEVQRLSQPHTYEDGKIDQPFFNTDTVIPDEPTNYDDDVEVQEL